jgi:Mg/Co/Ni transporter MgtE
MVEAASHDEGEELIQAVGQDKALQADVFEELDPEHQVEFIEERSNPDAAELLASMAPDDAADLISEIDQDRRAPILELLPEPQRRKVRSLLTYNPETAGGLMNPDFLLLPATKTVEAALAEIRQSKAPRETLSTVFVGDEEGRPTGAVPTVELIQSSRDTPLSQVMTPDLAHVHADWDVGATVRKMSDFNLAVAPVLDPDHRHLLGVITVDDVLELLLPTGWRRDFGVTSTAAED